MNDSNAIEMSKSMYGNDRKKQMNKSDEIERISESAVSSDLGSPVWKPRENSNLDVISRSKRMMPSPRQ